jgi:pimeloyl-ACP methyl ester carboxylesterase
MGVRAVILAVFIWAAPTAAGWSQTPADMRSVDCAEFEFHADDLDDGVTCGWVEVADRPGGEGPTFQLPVVVAEAYGSGPAGVPVLYLIGGPGIETLSGVPGGLQDIYWIRFRASHDLIFFDYRGTGRATPRPCAGFDAVAEALRDQAVRGEAATTARVDAAAACREELLFQGFDPEAWGTETMARDAHAVVRALGYDRFAILATSYGTLPAVELMRAHPQSVSAVVMDSAFPPDSPNGAEQIRATAEGYAALQAACDAEPECARRHPDIRADVAAVAARLDSRPLRLGERTVDGEAWLGAVWVMLLWGDTARHLPETASRIRAGDEALLASVVETFGASDVFGGYSHAQAWLASCRDLWGQQTAPAVAAAAATHPDLARGISVDEQDRVCAALGAGSADIHRPIGSDVPTLIYFGPFDPATPRSDAATALAGLSRGTLVEVVGQGHGPLNSSACTRTIAVRFFTEPSAAPDLSCLAKVPPVRLHDPVAFDAFVAGMSELGVGEAGGRD